MITIAYFLKNKISSDLVEVLYSQGLQDEKIADEVGCRGYHIGRWRRENKLPSHFRNSPRERETRLKKAKELYDAGKSDHEIADETHCSTALIRYWRVKNNLPANFNKFSQKLDYTKIMELYNNGLNDREIADQVNCNSSSVFRWRRINGLPAQHTQTVVDYTTARELYDSGYNDKEIATQLGVNTHTISMWRRSLRLPSTRRLPLTRERRNNNFWMLYEQGLSDVEIRDITGCDTNVVKTWRRSNLLPINKPRQLLRAKAELLPPKLNT